MTHAVQAAGGVLHRRDGDGTIEVCLVHRPRYDDWALPKGKLDDDEHPLAGAVREVAEETGWTGVPELRLPTVDYELPDGRPKTVDYWLMRATDGGPVQDTDEVDELAWLPPAQAAERVSYADERRILEHVAGLPPITAVAGLVRHAHAGERKAWKGNDALRPIDEQGRADAERMAVVLALLKPERLITATPLRCKQTLEPLSARLGGLPIVQDGAFAEPADADDAPAKAKVGAQRMLELRPGGVPVICSQGKVMPAMLAALHDESDPAPYKTAKGAAWLLTWSGDRLLDASRL
ncbi:NUDIX hydrolase [Paractinoplanes ferrugineus]|uniref:Hydrolase MutT/NUDIX n=1 Tax=Paractinoplanes ferrugineus TaxID=113564 RepID=A0A919IW14_9ACTN|nr:NUDIX domain-containing protein [Actinoplanes ferrugineus]GIE09057.1 putative hydrolase MutT/NUDIX [Actinoplanes ferrugineus]